mmetsp:Transcript_2734/g.8276  ORF Transcript_2734/g.8276 Transcript_2734/m.8276 type:complete len:307 (+) Transcript_2734:944-1864(+)
MPSLLVTTTTTTRRGRRALAPQKASLAEASLFLADVDGGVLALQALTSLFASVFGFGDALLAMPLLGILFHMDVPTAAPLVSVVSTAMIVGNLALDNAQEDDAPKVGRWPETACLLAGAALGVPLGVQALVAVDPDVIRGVVGLCLVAFGAAKLAKKGSSEKNAGDVDLLRVVVPVGFVAGFLGGAVAEPGPPAVVLSRLARWDAVTTRAMLFRFFLPVQALAIFDFSQNGLVTPGVLHQATATIPAVAVAVALGTVLNRRIQPSLFEDVVSGLVFALGLFCVADAANAMLSSVAYADVVTSPPPL